MLFGVMLIALRLPQLRRVAGLVPATPISFALSSLSPGATSCVASSKKYPAKREHKFIVGRSGGAGTCGKVPCLAGCAWISPCRDDSCL